MRVQRHTILMATSFLPIMLFKIISRTGAATLERTRVAAAIGLACAIVQYLLSKKLTHQATYLERAFLLFLAAGTLWVIFMPEAPAVLFAVHSTTLLYVVLCLTTLLPQSLGYDPFTYAIAKQWYPESVWRMPQFRTINLHITYTWSFLFFAAACSSFFGARPLFAIVLPIVLVLGVGLPFSKLYPDRFLKRTLKGQNAVRGAPFEGTARDLISRMPLAFNADAAQGIDATIQFLLSGDGGGEMALLLKDGRCTFQEGRATSPALTITSSAAAWLQIARGEVDRPKALMEGLFSVQGDTTLLMKMGTLFTGPSPRPDGAQDGVKGTTPAQKPFLKSRGRTDTMKILAIQGSPRPKTSNTGKILEQFLEGARSKGAETEIIYLKEKNIHPCVGCYTCWTKTPGVCVFKDDMPELLEKVQSANLLVYATPLYIFNVTALLKAFQERLLPLLDPHLVRQGDAYRHPKRYKGGPSGMVLISTCGFPEVSHFEALRQVFRHVERAGEVPLVGELLVPSAELVVRQEFIRKRAEGVFAAAFDAGVEVVTQGAVSKETEASVRQVVVAPDEMASMANMWWDSFNESSTHTPVEQMSAPNDMRLLLQGMALSLNPSIASTLKTAIQFDVTGGQKGKWYLAIENGVCTCSEGEASSPALTIITPSEVWLAIAAKEKDGRQAFMNGEYKAEGDLSLLMRLNSLFGS